ncbi:glycoside hydrolase family 43 protein [Rhodanobacter sp. Col0626]|uniref:glycoside hydrolase family 43 protein n=1 Tax=Rhodanobacter sp. Col0626 TaxID=3415679 RepID=UPI003CF7F743
MSLFNPSTRFLVMAVWLLAAGQASSTPAKPLATAASTAGPAHAGNPVFPGWYADPEAAVLEGQYWIYPTTSEAYDKQVYFDAFSSPDLVHWTKHSRVLEAKAVSWARRAMWAPAIVAKGGKYYFFFSANDIHDHDVGGIGVAVADHPAGPFHDLLGKPLIGAFHNGAQPIDQSVFKDTNGQYYIIYGGWKHANIARLKNDFTGVVPFDDGAVYKEITPSGYVEGPMMFIRNGKYYLMWSEGGWTGPDYSVAYAIADSPLGPFKRIGKILQEDPAIATGAGHHSLIHAGDDWYIVYHRRPLGETAANHRVVCVDRMYFDKQGFIKPVVITRQGVAAHPLH